MITKLFENFFKFSLTNTFLNRSFYFFPRGKKHFQCILTLGISKLERFVLLIIWQNFSCQKSTSFFKKTAYSIFYLHFHCSSLRGSRFAFDTEQSESNPNPGSISISWNQPPDSSQNVPVCTSKFFAAAIVLNLCLKTIK